MSDLKNRIAAAFLGLGLIIGKAIAIVYPAEHQQLLDHANSLLEFRRRW